MQKRILSLLRPITSSSGVQQPQRHHEGHPRTEGNTSSSSSNNNIRKRVPLGLGLLMALALCALVMFSSQSRLMLIYKKTGAAGAAAATWQSLILVMGDGAPRLKGPALYSHTRHDRSGMVIVEMLNAHAHAFSNGRMYGGSCHSQDKPPRHQLSAESLLKAMGLDIILPFACPRNESEGSVVKRGVYTTFLTHKNWKPNWISYIRSVASYPPRNTTESTAYLVAVHIRRGDVSPCKHTGRYLPNSHYLELMDLFIPQDRMKDVKVTIFSESDSFERWDDFFQSKYDCELALDGDLAETWKKMSIADLLILSRSTFSVVPAMLNRFGTIVYTKFPRSPLPDWKVAPQHVLDKSLQAVAAMASDHARCEAWHNRLTTTADAATTAANDEQQFTNATNATTDVNNGQ